MFDKISKQFNSLFKNINELFQFMSKNKKDNDSRFFKLHEEMRKDFFSQTKKDNFILFNGYRLDLSEIYYYSPSLRYHKNKSGEIDHNKFDLSVKICYKNGCEQDIVVRNENERKLLLHKLDNLCNVVNLNTTE